MGKDYPSNLTCSQYELLGILLPDAKLGGRFRSVDLWEVFNAMIYLLVKRCRWRALPGDFPSWHMVYTSFRAWRKDGTWVVIHDHLREWTRLEQDRHRQPSEAVIDSQSVKSAAMVHEAVGYDADTMALAAR